MKLIDKFITLLNIDTTVSSNCLNQLQKENQFWNILIDFLIEEGVSKNQINFLPIIHEHLNGDFTNEENFYKKDLSEVYKDRNNLFVKFSNNNKNKILLNCHIDTVPPFYPVAIFEDIDTKINARGAVDVKSGIFLMLSLIKLIKKRKLNIDFLFVIDEEIGGMGSKSFVSNPSFFDVYKSVVVFEPTNSTPFSANRGAQWFEIFLDTNINLYNEVVSPLLRMTNKLRSNCCDDDKNKIQLCFGIVNDKGEMPSSAISNFKFQTNSELPNILEILSYYPEVKSYLIELKIVPSLIKKEKNKYLIKTIEGHMGSLSRGIDSFITYAIIEDFCIKSNITIKSKNINKENILKGGIGVPLNISISEVRKMMVKYLPKFKINFYGVSNESYSSSLNYLFDKFKTHNSSFEFNSMWNASCDSRLFNTIAKETITFGPDSLDKAHSSNEEIEIQELFKSKKIISKVLCELD